jgi:hypothetical protein
MGIIKLRFLHGHELVVALMRMGGERERETEMGEIIKLRFLHLHEGKLFHLMRVERDGDGGSSLR